MNKQDSCYEKLGNLLNDAIESDKLPTSIPKEVLDSYDILGADLTMSFENIKYLYYSKINNKKDVSKTKIVNEFRSKIIDDLNKAFSIISDYFSNSSSLR
jgi:hypothetical protein